MKHVLITNGIIEELLAAAGQAPNTSNFNELEIKFRKILKVAPDMLKGVKLPQYVRLGNTVLRLDTENNMAPGGSDEIFIYTKDAGAWYVDFKVVNGKLIVKEKSDSRMFHANGKELIPSTLKKYERDNGKEEEFGDKSELKKLRKYEKGLSSLKD